eukprot:799638-Karenia_brevis.AAC.1
MLNSKIYWEEPQEPGSSSVKACTAAAVNKKRQKSSKPTKRSSKLQAKKRKSYTMNEPRQAYKNAFKYIQHHLNDFEKRLGRKDLCQILRTCPMSHLWTFFSGTCAPEIVLECIKKEVKKRYGIHLHIDSVASGDVDKDCQSSCINLTSGCVGTDILNHLEGAIQAKLRDAEFIQYK